MYPHPDLAGRAIPKDAVIDGFHLTPLGPPVVEEDYAAVMESTEALAGLYSDGWPNGLTLAENAIDLARHAREFSTARSLAWVVRDPSGQYLGCAYAYPEMGATGAGRIVIWIRDRPDRAALLARFAPIFRAWIESRAPATAAYVWLTSPRLD